MGAEVQALNGISNNMAVIISLMIEVDPLIDQASQVNPVQPVNGSTSFTPLPSNGALIGQNGFKPENASEDVENLENFPQSPYSANRTLLHNLTLPKNPNFDIPSSPSTPPASGMTEKFEHFLKLKQEGTHFNEKLVQSTALKNPCLLEKLMTFAGMEENEQYATTLTDVIWDPIRVPVWAFKDELEKTRQNVNKKKEEERNRIHREVVEFVTEIPPRVSVRKESPSSFGIGGRNSRPSASERVMAGLERTNPQASQ